MSEIYGAMPEEWSKLDLGLGLTEDLLPVVSNPGAKIARNSSVSALGKAPTRYNRDRQVAGIPRWTEHVATRKDIELWSLEPDYGICIQTRAVRALDVDIDDRDQADKVRQFIAARVSELPERSRSNSGNFLQAFRLP